MVEAQRNSSSSLPRLLESVCLKLVTQDASGLRFRRSIYRWKANLIRKPIQVVSRQKLFRINENRRNKSASRIYQGAMKPYFGLLDHVSCLGPLGGASRGWCPRLYKYQPSLSLGFGFCLVLDFLVKQTSFCYNCAAKAACCEPGPQFLILFSCGN